MNPFISEEDRLLLLSILPPEHPLAQALQAHSRLTALARGFAKAEGEENWPKACAALQRLEKACESFAPYYDHEVVYYSTVFNMLERK